MKYIKIVLFFVLVKYYVCGNNTVKIKTVFSDLTFPELYELCDKRSEPYFDLRDSLLPIWTELTLNIKANCTGKRNKNLISTLINGTLKCFDPKDHPNATEIEDLVDLIANKLCFYYKLGNFKLNHTQCIVGEEVQNCTEKHVIDSYFFTLAMANLNSDCNALKNLTSCTAMSVERNCHNFKTEYDNIVHDFLSNLKCKTN